MISWSSFILGMTGFIDQLYWVEGDLVLFLENGGALRLLAGTAAIFELQGFLNGPRSPKGNRSYPSPEAVLRWEETLVWECYPPHMDIDGASTRGLPPSRKSSLASEDGWSDAYEEETSE